VLYLIFKKKKSLEESHTPAAEKGIFFKKNLLESHRHHARAEKKERKKKERLEPRRFNRFGSTQSFNTPKFFISK
jgi:hypothetical protein